MSTSGETAFTLTARDFITRAMQEIRVTALGEEPEAHEIEAGRIALSGMLKSLQTQGVSWGLASVTLPFEAGKASLRLPVGVRAVEAARVALPNYSRELHQLTRAEYQRYPAKQAPGSPSTFYVDPQRDAQVMYVWPVPTTDTEITVDYARSLDTITDVSELIDVPEEWAEAIWTNLALRLSTGFGAEVLPELARRADMLMTNLLDSSRPESYEIYA